MAEVAFELRCTETDGARRLAVAGELDLATAPLLAEWLAEIDGPATGVVLVDLSRVTFIDGSGLRALAGAWEGRGADGGLKLEIVAASPLVRRVFELTGLALPIGSSVRRQPTDVRRDLTRVD